MNKKLLLAGLLAFTAQLAMAKDGYKIQVAFKNTQDTMVYLAHYYGKPLPTIYKSDSARIGKNGMATFQTKDSILGGIYMMLLSDKKTYFEFLLDNGDDIIINADVNNLPDGLTFKNSPENDRFRSYTDFLKGYSKEQQALQKELDNAKTSADTAAVREKGTKAAKELTDYRKNYAQKNKGSLLSSIFGALETPDVPDGKHYYENGTLDSTYAYRYYKAHYWDGFNFSDDRLIHTPVYDGKLDEYFNRVVVPVEDSIIKESDAILAKARGHKEIFKYTLWWLTRNVENSKIMGMDRVFVYLVENYYMKGDAYWLDNDALGKYYERAADIAPNLIGRVAPEIKMQDIAGKPNNLYDLKAKYTLVVFWDPTCGHCTKEVPQIDSVYKAVLKQKGVKVYSVRTEGDEKLWQEFIKKHKLEDWTNVYDPGHKSDYRSKYDVYSTPVVYLLDEKKIIRGKRIDHTNIMSVIDMLERKEKTTKN